MFLPARSGKGIVMRWTSGVLVFAVTSVITMAAVYGAEKLPPVDAMAVGDFDGDGVTDVAVGLPQVTVARKKKAGQVRIYSGKTGKLIATVSGAEKEEELGGSLAAVGDVDGDGATDLAIGSPWADSGARVDIVSGKTGKLIRKHSGGNLVSWGDNLCALGDGSGLPPVDLIIGTGSSRQWRYAYTSRIAVGNYFRAETGYTVTTRYIGDVNADKAPDFALSNWNATVDGIKAAGRITVISGKAIRFKAQAEQVLFVIEGKREGARLGITMAPAGDWDGDGRADFFAGSPGLDARNGPTWRIAVFSGKDGAELWSVEGGKGEFSLGGAALVGDLDEDGKPDVAIGTPSLNKKAGTVRVFAAKDKSVLWTVEGARREKLGERLAAIRDADEDGFADLVVLSSGAAVDRKRGNGYVRLLSGKTGKAITFINPLRTK